MQPFYRRRAERFEPTPSTRGPWDERFQHGGPPSALLTHALTQAHLRTHGEGFVLTRMTAEFLRPVPLTPLAVEVEAPVGGRTVQRVRARLIADKEAMHATGVFVRADPEVGAKTLVRPGAEDQAWPDPEGLESFEFPFFRWEEAYHKAIDVRVVDEPWGTTPIRCWARPRVPLIDDTPATPTEATVLVADAESGMGPPVDPREFAYPNPDLTVYFGRVPAGKWIGYEIRSRADGPGIGLAESRLRDAAGVFGQCAQALIVSRT